MKSCGSRERDNWGSLYLYDLATGKLKNQVTQGDGNVTQVLHVDEKAHAISTSPASARRRAAIPYFRALLSREIRRHRT